MLATRLEPFGDLPNYIPRLGLRMELPKRFDQFTWYGYGPQGTYMDRKQGARRGVYSGSVEEQFEPYIVPGHYGNKTDVRWAALTDDDGAGFLAYVPGLFDVSAHHIGTDNLERARYLHQLRPGDTTVLCVDGAMSGVGEKFRIPLEPYRVKSESTEGVIILRPFGPDAPPVEELSRRGMPYTNVEELPLKRGRDRNGGAE